MKSLLLLLFTSLSITAYSQIKIELTKGDLFFESPFEMREYIEDRETEWGFDTCEYGIEIMSYEVGERPNLRGLALQLVDDLGSELKENYGELKNFSGNSLVFYTEDWGYEDECNNLEYFPYLIGVVYLEEQNKVYELLLDCFQISAKQGFDILNTFHIK